MIAYVLNVDMEEGRDGKKNDMCVFVSEDCVVLCVLLLYQSGGYG